MAKNATFLCSTSVGSNVGDAFQHIQYQETEPIDQASPFVFEIKKWPRRIGFCCWHDCHTFPDSVPIPLPLSKDSVLNKWLVKGVFCSPNCVVAYIFEHQASWMSEQLMLLNEMMREVFGCEKPVVAAPPRSALQMFGGPLSIADFRQKSLQWNWIALEPPFISVSMVFARSLNRFSQEARQANNNQMIVEEKGDQSASIMSLRGLSRPTATSSDADVGFGENSVFLNFVKQANEQAATAEPEKVIEIPKLKSKEKPKRDKSKTKAAEQDNQVKRKRGRPKKSDSSPNKKPAVAASL